MKRRILNLMLILIIIGLAGYHSGAFNSLFKPSSAYAVGDLTVNWGVPLGQPIFNINNIAPGDVETHVVNVSNGAPTGRPVAVRGILTNQTQNLGTVMDIVIQDGGTDVYGGTSGTGLKTLAEFFSDSASMSGIPLSMINPGGNKNYSFIVTFQQSAGNEFQNANIVFDLHIGISFDLPVACQNTNFPNGPIFGTVGNDRINGTLKNDLIITFDGNDNVSSGNGNDCIVSGNGNNSLDGGNGKDLIISGNGINTFDGGNENDIIVAVDGNNKVDGGNGDDQINVGNGNNNIDSGNGNDQVNTGNGINKILGGNGNDNLITVGNSSSVDGGNGIDTCVANVKKKCEL